MINILAMGVYLKTEVKAFNPFVGSLMPRVPPILRILIPTLAAQQGIVNSSIQCKRVIKYDSHRLLAYRPDIEIS